MNRIIQEKIIYRQLEKLRKYNQCPDHKGGAISIVYSPKDKSWLYSCEEVALPEHTPRSDGKCFWHLHFDPSDWEN